MLDKCAGDELRADLNRRKETMPKPLENIYFKPVEDVVKELVVRAGRGDSPPKGIENLFFLNSNERCFFREIV